MRKANRKDNRPAETNVLRIIGQESKEKGTDKFSSREIDEIIRDTRAKRAKRK